MISRYALLRCHGLDAKISSVETIQFWQFIKLWHTTHQKDCTKTKFSRYNFFYHSNLVVVYLYRDLWLKCGFNYWSLKCFLSNSLHRLEHRADARMLILFISTSRCVFWSSFSLPSITALNLQKCRSHRHRHCESYLPSLCSLNPYDSKRRRTAVPTFKPQKARPVNNSAVVHLYTLHYQNRTRITHPISPSLAQQQLRRQPTAQSFIVRITLHFTALENRSCPPEIDKSTCLTDLLLQPHQFSHSHLRET